MSSYLEGYGESDAKQSKVIKWILLGVPALALLGVVLYFQFRDYSLDRKAQQFLDVLKQGDYKNAYAMWGCTDANPCPQYPIEEFLKDWGPSSPYRDASQAAIAGRKSCEGGVIEFVRFPGQPDLTLWVDRRTSNVGFAPWQIKSIPPGFRHRLQEWMWEATRNCTPLIGP